MAEDTTGVRTLPARRDVPAGDTWDLASLFRSDGEWETALAAWEARIPGFAAFAGTLGSAPERLAACLAFDLDYDRELGEPLGLVEREDGLLKLWFIPDQNGLPPIGDYGIGMDVSTGEGATPALALCIAALKARELQYAR